MNLKDKLHDRVFIPVSVEKELPPKGENVFVIKKDEFEDVEINIARVIPDGTWYAPFKAQNGITHFLKPTEQSYVLSPDELRLFAEAILEAAKTHIYDAIDGSYNQHPITTPDKQQYINNLTL